MSYQGRRRAPRKRLIDRIRDWWYGEEEEQPLTDDHGNHIGGDLPGYQYDDEPQVIRTTEVGGVHLPNLGHDDPLPVNPRVNCAFAREVMPVGQSDYSPARMQVRGVPRGTLVNVPRPRYATPQTSGSSTADGPALTRDLVALPGPGHLTMWDLIQVPGPASWKPRTWPPIVSGPRLCDRRIALLAGAR